jgi:hypothetical protein
MATEEQISQFKELSANCIENSPDLIVEKPEWGIVNFKDSREHVQRMQDMLRHFDMLPVELVPDQEMGELVQAAIQTQSVLEQISKFSIAEGENPTQARDSLAQQLKTAAEELYRQGHNWIPYLAYQKGDIQRNIEQLSQTVKEANALVDETKSEIEAKNSEINSIIDAAREASASVGVAHFTGDFSGEASELSKVARNWLAVTGILAAITFGAAWLMINFGISAEATTAQIIQHVTSKLVMLGLLFTATIWAGRVYKATMHQTAVNKHRANALKTFQAFVKAADDAGTRDAVLMETTRSIFTLTSSGYLDESSVSQNSGVKVVEIVKSTSELATKID